MTLTPEQIDESIIWIKQIDSVVIEGTLPQAKTILTALKMAKGSVWQPIDSAPKNIARVLVLWTDFVPSHESYDVVEMREGSFFDVETGESYRKPTYWMPLPQSPQENLK